MSKLRKVLATKPCIKDLDSKRCARAVRKALKKKKKPHRRKRSKKAASTAVETKGVRIHNSKVQIGTNNRMTTSQGPPEPQPRDTLFGPRTLRSPYMSAPAREPWFAPLPAPTLQSTGTRAPYNPHLQSPHSPFFGSPSHMSGVSIGIPADITGDVEGVTERVAEDESKGGTPSLFERAKRTFSPGARRRPRVSAQELARREAIGDSPGRAFAADPRLQPGMRMRTGRLRPSGYDD